MSSSKQRRGGFDARERIQESNALLRQALPPQVRAALVTYGDCTCSNLLHRLGIKATSSAANKKLRRCHPITGGVSPEEHLSKRSRHAPGPFAPTCLRLND